MDNIYVYLVPLPSGVNEAVMPCMDGFTVYIDQNLDPLNRQKAYDHAIGHIREDDYKKTDVQEIEWERHQ